MKTSTLSRALHRTVDKLPAALLAAEPLYKQVKQDIVRSLTQGAWKPGEKLPVESQLAARYGVGISTIRAAIGELVAGKILARKQGKGTFVSLQDDRRSLYQFFRVVRDDGVQELPVSELVWFKRVKAEDDFADRLRLPRTAHGSDVFKLRNILRVSGTPVVVSDIVIPAVLFPGLTETLAREGGTTLYAVYQTHFGINIIRTVEQLRAVKASPTIAKILGLPAHDPVLEIQRTAYTFGNKLIELRTSRVLTSNFYYLSERGNAD